MTRPAEQAPATSGPAFIRVRSSPGGPVVEGSAEGTFGHRLPRAGSLDDGVFAAWRWDGRCLRVQNDRYGMFPLFRAAFDDGIAVSTSLVELLRRGVSPVLDLEALLVFRGLGFFLGEDTPFAHIKALPPSCALEWDGELRLTENRPVGERVSIDRAEAIIEYERLFRDAVHARLTDAPFAVPLSGGRDSRHLLFELLAAGQRPALCVTARHEWPYATNDVEIARSLALELDLPHVEAPRLPQYEAETRKNVLTHFCADEHGWMVAVGDVLRGRVDSFFDGIAGDVLSASLFQSEELLAPYAEGRLDAVADGIIRDDGTPHPEFRLPHTLSVGEVTELRRARVVEELRRYERSTNPISMFYFYNRTRREIALAPFGVLEQSGTAFCPYIDHALFDFLASLPPALTLDKSFHTETIATAFPQFAEIPYSTGWRAERRGAGLERFAFDIVRHGLAARPSRLPDVGRLVAQHAGRSLSQERRERERRIDPIWLTYLWQLEDVARSARASTLR